jgi:predicted esterase
MRRAAALAALVLLPARSASAEVLDAWPCAGCITVTPPHADAGPPGPRPLLVALHGDGGLVRPLVRAFRAATAASGVILLAPQCPGAMGCTAGSFWQWLDTSGHDPAWLGAQIDAVAARFPVDPARVYAAGYSGGATYLGWYAPTHAGRFAAVAHLAGGAAYRPPCPSCKTPVLFLLGATDPMIGPYTRPLRDWYGACGGHEIVWETLPGVTHESILQVLEAGRARQVLSWLLGHPSACAEEGPLDAGSEAGTEPDPEPLPEIRAGSGAGSGGAMPPPPPRIPPAASGCACRAGASPRSRVAPVMVPLLLFAAQRRRDKLARRARGA